MSSENTDKLKYLFNTVTKLGMVLLCFFAYQVFIDVKDSNEQLQKAIEKQSNNIEHISGDMQLVKERLIRLEIKAEKQ